MLPSTWQECWSNEQAGHSIQENPCATWTSCMQNFHSLKERLKVGAVIVDALWWNARKKKKEKDRPYYYNILFLHIIFDEL